MDAKPNTSKVLMSEVLEGNVSDLEGSSVTSEFVVIVLSVLVNAGIEPVVGSVKAYERIDSDQYVVSAAVSLEDGFGLAQATDDLTISVFELHFMEDVVPVTGPFKVTGVKVSDLDHQRQMCTLTLKLCRG